jgi:hypothetical protein
MRMQQISDLYCASPPAALDICPAAAPADVCDVITAVASQLASNHFKVNVRLNVNALQQPSSADALTCSGKVDLSCRHMLTVHNRRGKGVLCAAARKRFSSKVQ